jgi:hypothetical protein
MSSSNGNGNGNGGVALMKMGSAGAGELSAVGAIVSAESDSASAFGDTSVVAESPGGDWSRFKGYSTFKARLRRRQGSRPLPVSRELPDPRPRGARAHAPARAPRPQRTFEIWSFVFKFVLKRIALNLKWTYALAGGFSEEKKKARLVAQAVWLREGLLRLGPTFIKVWCPCARSAHANAARLTHGAVSRGRPADRPAVLHAC